MFVTKKSIVAICEYGSRWESESGCGSVKRFTAATTSKNSAPRFLYFTFACLLYPTWRAVDFVPIELTDGYDRSPAATANAISRC